MKSTKTRLAAFVMAFALVCSSVLAVPEMTQAATKATKITVSSTKKTVYVGKSFNLKVKKVTPSKASKNVTYKTSNKQIATVTSKGKVTGKKAGKAVITVTSKTNKTATAKCTVTVKQQVKSIQTASEMVMKKGKSASIKYSVLPANAASKKVKFKSSKPSVVSVDKKGKLKAKKEGSAKIEVKSEDGFAKTKINVTVKKKVTEVSKIKLNKKSTELTIGKTEKLKATVSPSKATSKKVYWVSSNPKAVTVDKNGKVKAVAAGTAKVTAYATDNSGKSASCTVKAVKPQPKPTPKPPVTGPDDSNTDNSKPDTDNSKPDDTKPPVTEPEKPQPPVAEITGITVSVDKDKIKANETATVTAKVTGKGDFDENVTLTSSNKAFATIENGKVVPTKDRAFEKETVTITAKAANGMTAECDVTITWKENVFVSSVTENAYVYNVYKFDKNAEQYTAEKDEDKVSVKTADVLKDKAELFGKVENATWEGNVVARYWDKITTENLKKSLTLTSLLITPNDVKVEETGENEKTVTATIKKDGKTVTKKAVMSLENDGTLKVEYENSRTVTVKNIQTSKVNETEVKITSTVSENTGLTANMELTFDVAGKSIQLKKGNSLVASYTGGENEDHIVKVNLTYAKEIAEHFGITDFAGNLEKTNVYNLYIPE